MLRLMRWIADGWWSWLPQFQGFGGGIWNFFWCRDTGYVELYRNDDCAAGRFNRLHRGLDRELRQRMFFLFHIPRGLLQPLIHFTG